MTVSRVKTGVEIIQFRQYREHEIYLTHWTMSNIIYLRQWTTSNIIYFRQWTTSNIIYLRQWKMSNTLFAYKINGLMSL